MKRPTRILLLATMVGTLTGAMSGGASAHFVDVGPSGTCQFLGGPGNPGHPGHTHGHVVALAAERSGAISIGSC